MPIVEKINEHYIFLPTSVVKKTMPPEFCRPMSEPDRLVRKYVTAYNHCLEVAPPYLVPRSCNNLLSQAILTALSWVFVLRKFCIDLCISNKDLAE